MNVIESTVLNWKVTTVKRAGLIRDLSSGNPKRANPGSLWSSANAAKEPRS